MLKKNHQIRYQHKKGLNYKHNVGMYQGARTLIIIKATVGYIIKGFAIAQEASKPINIFRKH